MIVSFSLESHFVMNLDGIRRKRTGADNVLVWIEKPRLGLRVLTLSSAVFNYLRQPVG